jgi:hypothetical protein
MNLEAGLYHETVPNKPALYYGITLPNLPLPNRPTVDVIAAVHSASLNRSAINIGYLVI